LIDQPILDSFAQGIATTLHARIGARVGYAAKVDKRSDRVVFTYKANELSAHCTVPFSELAKANSWQALGDSMVLKALTHLDPKVTFAPTNEPEVPVFIDPAGKRHFTLKADTGRLGLAFG
jgi:hypothetical protein